MLKWGYNVGIEGEKEDSLFGQTQTRTRES